MEHWFADPQNVYRSRQLTMDICVQDHRNHNLVMPYDVRKLFSKVKHINFQLSVSILRVL